MGRQTAAANGRTVGLMGQAGFTSVTMADVPSDRRIRQPGGKGGATAWRMRKISGSYQSL